MSKFTKTYKIIMESIDTNFKDLYQQIKDNEDQEMLNQWVEAIDEAGLIDHQFDIDEMAAFDETLDDETLDEVISIGLEILHANDEEDDQIDECDGECSHGSENGDVSNIVDEEDEDIDVDGDDIDVQIDECGDDTGDDERVN